MSGKSTSADLSIEPDEVAIYTPDEEGSDDNGGFEVVDVGGGGLQPKTNIALAKDGEWIKNPPPGESTGRVGDLYKAFVQHATSYARLSEEEEHALGVKIQKHQDKGAAKKLVVHNLRLAIKMAHQYRRAWTNLMDLVQEASTGMAIAAQKWDPDHGTRYGTYAVYWIRAQLTKFLMTHGRIIHTGNTRAGRKLYYQLPRIRRKLLAEGKPANIENIAKEVGEDVVEVERVVSRLTGRETSLSTPLNSEAGNTIGDMIPSKIDTPEQHAHDNSMQDMMQDLVVGFSATLENERDAAIWTEHLLSHDPKSLVALGKRFGVSKQRMGQLASRIKKKFRRYVIERLGPHTELSWLFDAD